MSLNPAYRKHRIQRHKDLLQRIRNPTEYIPTLPGFPPGKVRGEKYFGVQPPPDLPEYIHPIFAYSDQWNAPKWQHDRMNLGIRLASQLLMSPPAMQYLSKALFGVIATDSQGREYLQDIPLTRSLLQETRKTLEETAPYVEYDFTDLGDYFDEGSSHAETDCQHPRTRLVPDDRRCHRYAHLQGLPMLITFNTRLVDNFNQNNDPDFELRMQFNFANTLLHELGHVIFYLTRMPLANPPTFDVGILLFSVPTPKEPRFHQNTLLKDVEFGFEFELALFNRIIMSAGSTYLPTYGLWAEPITGDKSSEPMRQLIPMAWVAWWFRADSLRNYNIQGQAAMPPMTDFWYSIKDGSLEIAS